MCCCMYPDEYRSIEDFGVCQNCGRNPEWSDVAREVMKGFFLRDDRGKLKFPEVVGHEVHILASYYKEFHAQRS